MPIESIYTRRDGMIATIYLNRPEDHNALTIEMWDRLIAAIDAADRETATKVIVITGEGKDFAAGPAVHELEQGLNDPKFGAVLAETMCDARIRLARNIKPTIAKIRGTCTGGAMGLALACDLRFADPTAKFAITAARLGIAFSFPDTKRLVETVGPARAKDLLYTGRTADAEEAHAIGLVDWLVPAAELDNAVRSYAAQIAAASQYTTRASKRIVQKVLEGTADEDRASRRLFVDAFSGADFREGVSAFIQKRKPIFPVA